MKRIIELLKRLFSKQSKPINPMKKKTTFTGQPFKVGKIKEYVGNFKKQIEEKKTLKETFTDANGLVRVAEFFGKTKLDSLLNPKIIGKDILGVRIYYGIAPEDKEGNITDAGTLAPRLFIVPVGLDGKDLTFDHTALKDEPDGDGLGDGVPQPPFHE